MFRVRPLVVGVALLLLVAPVAVPAQSARMAITVSAVAPTDTLPFYYAIHETRAWLDKSGVDATNVKFVETSPASMAAALAQKRIDAAVMYEPFLSAAMATGSVRPIGKPYDAIAPHFMPSVWFGNSAWMTDHRDATMRFAQVLFQAQAYTNAHYDELIPLIADFSKLTPDVLRKTPVVKVFPTLQGAMLQPLLDAGAKYKELNRPVRAQELFFPGVP